MNSSLLKRFYEYQLERFPVHILLFTTLSVILGSFVIILKDVNLLLDEILLLCVGAIVCLLYTFHIRVLDEIKDYSFDNKFHKDRPIQRGLISISELVFIDRIFLLVQVLLIYLFSFKSLIFWGITYLYSLVAKFEFFMKSKARKNFLIYNLLNLFQMFFLQIFLYSLILTSITWYNPFLYVHFIYLLGKVFLLEVARKLKVKTLENKGKDTYSARFGIKKASFLFLVALFLTSGLFLSLLNYLNSSLILYLLFLILIIIQVGVIIIYIKKQEETQVKFIELSALLFYVLTDVLLVVSII
ncbi:MAG: UbiA family prenyltransferase [Nanoarchaeales archaeon]|nr:UbiA family prenyltransferase [Nanoarchaeales archaeon]